MKHVFAIGLLLFAAHRCFADDSGKLAPEQAKLLVSEAAGINFDLDDLAQGINLPTTNQSPTFWVLTYKSNPGVPLPKNAEKDFDFTATERGVNVQDVLKALKPANAKGCTTIIQPEYITECRVKSDGKTATGYVAFKCKAYSGSINFKAVKTGSDWVIREFEWPNIGVRFARGKDGNWSNERINKP